MLTISDGGSLSRALSTDLDPRLKQLLATRFEQLGGEIVGIARFVVVQPGDRSSWLTQALGFSVFQNPGEGTWYGDPDHSPSFEYIEDHGFAYEMTFEFTTDLTHVVIVENAPGAPKALLDFCTTYAPEHA